jgi:GNAT superfamily N-acetyltransferase
MQKLDLANGYYELPPGKLANIATFMELRGLPQRKLMPWPDTLKLVRLGRDDGATFLHLFRAVGTDLMWFSRLLMTAEKLSSILADPDVHSFALMEGDQTVGVLELDYRTKDDCELAFFGLIPGAIGRGQGRALMDEAIRQAWLQPIKRMWLHTCTLDSPQAMAFYLRSGFKPYARMVEIHDDYRLSGQLPLHAAPHIPVLG